MHTRIFLCINQHTQFKVPSFTDSKDMTRAKFFKWVTWPWTCQLGVVCHPKASTLSFQPFQRYHWRPQKLKMGYVTLTLPILREICYPNAELDIAYLCSKRNHSSFYRFRDNVGAYQNLNDSHDPPFKGRFVFRALGLATCLPNLKPLSTPTTKI